MSRALKYCAALALFAIGALLTHNYLRPPTSQPEFPEREQATAAEAELPGELRSDLTGADDLRAARLLRNALEEFRGDDAEPAIRRAMEARAIAATVEVEKRVQELLQDFRYRTAAELVGTHRRHWVGTSVPSKLTTLLDELRNEQSLLVEGRRADAEALFDAGRYDAAREAIATRWELEGSYRDSLNEISETLELKIRRANLKRQATHAATVARPVIPVAQGEPGPPPPLSGVPHADVKRLGEARRLVVKARDLFLSRRIDPAQRAVDDLLTSYSDLYYVDRNRAAIEAIGTLARHARGGVEALFHATEVKKRGSRLTLRYLFKNQVEMKDWEEFVTILHADSGSFEYVRGAVRGNGVMTLCNRAFFKNDVTMRCETEPMKLKTHGLAFCQAGLETRQIMLLATNHWFVEGENYVKVRPGHSVIMIGKGTNADVPIDSPEIGFIFRQSNETPDVRLGQTVRIEFKLKGSRMSGSVAAGGKSGSLRGEATGDDGRGMSLLRPSLFVVQNSARFRKVEIEGVLHPHFERERLDELLDEVASLDNIGGTVPARSR